MKNLGKIRSRREQDKQSSKKSEWVRVSEFLEWNVWVVVKKVGENFKGREREKVGEDIQKDVCFGTLSFLPGFLNPTTVYTKKIVTIIFLIMSYCNSSLFHSVSFFHESENPPLIWSRFWILTLMYFNGNSLMCLTAIH